MSRTHRSWTFGILFWVILLTSGGLSGRYPWLDATWFIGIMLFIVVVSVVPRFGQWALWDDEQLKLWDAKPKSKARG
jgi:hypothetical protein